MMRVRGITLFPMTVMVMRSLGLPDLWVVFTKERVFYVKNAELRKSTQIDANVFYVPNPLILRELGGNCVYGGL
ncbi:hypothetical protein GCM10007094_20150 [Pseudovibrio japonicus]|uniref:Uncharacterized protein n=1 Tax=Pseudovibrio japonicus TaxID=366534 RepID=A0ABQ3EI47_9HYPH|nr:hypothetical protein GCM10007094_20150 [Pseudovibrio japonicus]